MEPPGPVPCAAQQGTTFVIEDLFYNIDQRRKVSQGSLQCNEVLSSKHACHIAAIFPGCRPWQRMLRSMHGSWILLADTQLRVLTSPSRARSRSDSHGCEHDFWRAMT